MTKYLVFFLLLSFSHSLNAQNVNNLEIKYGFKQFKFGISPSLIKNISKDERQADKNKNISVYTYNGEDLKYLYNVEVEKLSLTFYKNKLYSIIISFGSLEREYSDKEFNLVQYSLEKVFGSIWKNPKDESILNGAIWKSKRVTLEHLKFDFSKNRPDRINDGYNYIQGYISIYENNIQNQRLSDDF